MNSCGCAGYAGFGELTPAAQQMIRQNEGLRAAMIAAIAAKNTPPSPGPFGIPVPVLAIGGLALAAGAYFLFFRKP